MPKVIGMTDAEVRAVLKLMGSVRNLEGPALTFRAKLEAVGDSVQLHQVWKPSRKGLLEYEPSDRIIAVSSFYLWFRQMAEGYSFRTNAEAFEYRGPGEAKPTSFWLKSDAIDPSVIRHPERILIHAGDEDTELGLLARMGVRHPALEGGS